MEPTVYDLAEQLRASPPTSEAVAYRVVDVHGFSSRFSSDLAARDAGEWRGEILGGLADDQLADAPSGLREVAIGDAAALRAGLSCGGRARVLVQPLRDVPAEFWRLLERREPVLLVTDLTEARLGRTEAFGEQSVAAVEADHPGAARVFARGTSVAATTETALISAYWPPHRLVIIGGGGLADALVAHARLLDWEPSVLDGLDGLDGPDGPDGLDQLGPGDAVVILSHDRAIDVPALQQALAGRVGYIGGLGSRRTQDNRTVALAELGIDPGNRVHGPAGLDLGAFSPAEVALSIVAEIMAVWAGVQPASLSSRAGRIHA